MYKMPEFLKYREAETKLESLQEAIWSEQETIKVFSRELERGIAKVAELTTIGAIPAARRVSKENRFKEEAIANAEKNLAKWEAKLAELS